MMFRVTNSDQLLTLVHGPLPTICGRAHSQPHIGAIKTTPSGTHPRHHYPASSSKAKASHPHPDPRRGHGGRARRGVAASAATEVVVAAVVEPQAAAAAAEALRAVRVAREGRAPQLPRLPRLALRRPLHGAAPRRLVGGVLPPRRRGPVGRRRVRPRAPGRRRPRAAAAVRRAGAGVAHPGGHHRVPLPHGVPPPARPPRAALPRPPPPRLRGGPRGVHGGARGLLPRPRLPPLPLRPRRGRLQGLLVLRRPAVPLPVVVRRRLRARARLLGIPHRRLLHCLRPLPDHLLPADPADEGVRARVLQVHRRRRRARAPPRHQEAAPQDQPPLPPVHTLVPRPRHREPVLRAARHHKATRADQPRHRRRARALLNQPRRRFAGLPPERGQDHAQDAGDHERRGGVARRRHHQRLQQRPGEPQPGPAGHHRLHGAGERLLDGLRRGVRLRVLRLLLQRRRIRRLQVHSFPEQQHLLPEEAGTGDVPGEQPGRHHGVRLRRRQDMAARAVHDRVLPCHVAAGEDGRYFLNLKRVLPPVEISSSPAAAPRFLNMFKKVSASPHASWDVQNRVQNLQIVQFVCHIRHKQCHRSERLPFFFVLTLRDSD